MFAKNFLSRYINVSLFLKRHMCHTALTHRMLFGGVLSMSISIFFEGSQSKNTL